MIIYNFLLASIIFTFIIFLDNDSVDSVSSAVQDSDQELTTKSK